MIKSWRLSVLFLLAVLLFGACGQPSQPAPAAVVNPTAAPGRTSDWDNLVTAAQKEGNLVIYAGPIGEARDALMKAFREKYGITVDITIGRGDETVAKLENERRAGIYAADVCIQGMTVFFSSIKPMGITLPIQPLLVLPEVRDLSKWREGKLPLADKEGLLAALVLASTPHMAANTDLVKPGAITTHTDLLDPKWRGKLVIADPSLGGSGAEWFTFVVQKLMGLEKGTAFMRQLAKQDPMVTRDLRLQGEWVARGKYSVAVAPNKATVNEFARAGAPLAFVDMKDPRPTSSGAGNLMVFDKAPHPNATKLFVNWLLSKEGSTIYAQAVGYPSTRLDVPTDGVDPILIPGPGDVILGEDYQMTKGDMTKLGGEIFRDLVK